MPQREGRGAEALAERLAGAKGVLFDKDGTLFDFDRSWGALGYRVIVELSQGERRLARALAESGGYDLDAGRFAANSPVVSGSVSGLAALWSEILGDWTAEELEIWLRAEVGSMGAARMAPAATDLPGLLRRLRAGGLVLGVATHDAEEATRGQLARAGALDAFAFIAGYDSGYAAKPDPAMLLGFCAATGLRAGEVVVVGDSHHDLRMGRGGRALAAIGVLSGPAGPDLLAPEADLLLPSIEDLPDALGL